MLKIQHIDRMCLKSKYCKRNLNYLRKKRNGKSRFFPCSFFTFLIQFSSYLNLYPPVILPVYTR